MNAALRLVLLILLVQASMGQVLAQAPLNGSFETGGYFDLSGWSWDCEEPEPTPGYQSNWGVKKLTAVTGVPPDPCSGVTLMVHPIADSANAIYTITGWAFVDDPNMSASIGFGYTDGWGGVNHQGDYTNSTSWEYLTYTGDHGSLFQWFAPQASLNVSDGLNGYGYAYFDGLELTISSASTGLAANNAALPHVSLSPDGAQLAVWAPAAGKLSVQLFDALGKAESSVVSRSLASSDPLIIDVAGLATGLHFVVVHNGQLARTERFVRR